MKKDLHADLRSRWTPLWEELCSTPYNRLSQSEIFKKMIALEEISKKIGGSVFKDIEELSSDVKRYLLGSMSLSETHRMMEHALRIEQDTEEL